MSPVDPLLARNLDSLAPADAAAAGDWQAVLRDARRPARRRAATVLLAAAAVGVAVLAGVTWPLGSGNVDVLARARAAIGSGPVIHVVFQPRRVGSRIELRTGARLPLYARHELWYDPKRGMHEQWSLGAVPEQHAWALPVEIPGDQQTIFQGFGTNYARALATNRARVIGKGKVDGRSVYWIRFVPDPILYRTYGTSYEVAVDTGSFAPVLVRRTANTAPLAPPDPRAASEERIFQVGSAPVGAGGLDRVRTIRLRGDEPEIAGSEALGPRTLANVRTAMPDALWLGRSFAGLPLREARVDVLDVFSNRLPSIKPRLRSKSVSLSYARDHERKPLVVVQEWPRTGGARFLGIPPVQGEVFVRGSMASLRVGRLSVVLHAEGLDVQRTLVAAARALRMIRVG
jgi:hypothetical protein